jgi:hypothetical protein
MERNGIKWKLRITDVVHVYSTMAPMHVIYAYMMREDVKWSCPFVLDEDVKRSCPFILSSFFSESLNAYEVRRTMLIKFQSIINNIIMKLNDTYEE